MDPRPSAWTEGSWDLLLWRLPCLRARERELSVREPEMLLVCRGRLILVGLSFDSEPRSAVFPLCSEVFTN